MTGTIDWIRDFDPDNETENDAQAKLLETSQNLAEEQFLRIRYDCDLLIPKPKSPTPPPSGGRVREVNVVWYCDNCNEGPVGGWQNVCLNCSHTRCVNCVEETFTRYRGS